MKLGSTLKQASGLALFILLGGCSSLAPEYTEHFSDESAPRPTASTAIELDRFLNRAAPQTSAVLADSPWGQQLEVSTDAPYYSASGLICRPLSVGAAQLKALACLQPGGRWIPSRVFN